MESDIYKLSVPKKIDDLVSGFPVALILMGIEGLERIGVIQWKEAVIRKTE